MRGEVSPVMISAIVIGLRVKRESIGEISAAAEVMRELATRVEVENRQNLVDTCGTGETRHTHSTSQQQRPLLQQQQGQESLSMAADQFRVNRVVQMCLSRSVSILIKHRSRWLKESARSVWDSCSLLTITVR